MTHLRFRTNGGFATHSPPTQATNYSPADHRVVLESHLPPMQEVSVTLRAKLKQISGIGPKGPTAPSLLPGGCDRSIPKPHPPILVASNRVAAQHSLARS